MVDDSTDPQADGAAPKRPYVVLARRYRPQSFADLIGQKNVTRALTSAIETGRVGHAYLFTGARGVGKTSMARILAKALNCQSGPTTSPCCQCDICASIGVGEDTDVLEIDGASNRGIDEIRQLRQNVGVRPTRSRFKIYIIDEVHMLTKEAFNALLKTLEEPPAHVKFIFATTEPHKIPGTILSRCQRFDFVGIDTQTIHEQLGRIVRSEGLDAEPEAIELVARRAAGSMRDGQSLLEQLLAVGHGRVTVQDAISMLGLAPAARLARIVDHLVDRRGAGALAELDTVLADGADVGGVLEQLLGFFRDTMAVSVGCGSDQMRFTTPSQYGEVTRWAEQFGLAQLLAAVQILDQTLARMRVSVHGRTLAEVAVVRITHLEVLDDLSELVAGLAEGDRPAAGPAVPARPARAAPPGSGKKKSPSAEAPPGRPEAEVAAGAGPAAAASPAAALTGGSAASVWQRVLDVLAEQAELVAEQAARVQSVTAPAADRLVASFPAKYIACKSFCEQPEQRLKLESGLAAATGRPVRLQFEVLPGDAAPGDGGAAPSRRQLQLQVGTRPFVRRAMELFDATQIQVEPPRGSADGSPGG